MSDHSKRLAEEAWARFDDSNSHLIGDIQNLDDVLAQHEQARMEAWMDSMSDPFDDGDDD